MTSRRRLRTNTRFQTGGGLHTNFNFNGSVFNTVPEGKITFEGLEVCNDENHGTSLQQSEPTLTFGPKVKSFVRHDVGGPFALRDAYWKSISDGHGTYKDGLRQYVGGFVPRTLGWPNIVESSSDYLNWTGGAELANLETHGPTAVARFKPGQPVVDLGQAVAELGDFPRLFRFRLGQFKDLGSNYLNVEFGWKPFLSDLRKLYHVERKITKRLLQLQRDNGRRIRRRGTVRKGTEKVLSDVTTSTYGAMTPILPTLYYAQTPQISVKSVITERIWFSGSFRYWIPNVGTQEWVDSATSSLFGLDPTPSLLWEVLPFSWLVDWYSNIGDVLNNISSNAAESLVMDRGYLMSGIEKRTEFKAEARLSVNKSHTSHVTVNPELHFIEQVKLRAKASPFGFALTKADLNLRQLAILAALGLTMT